MNGFVPVLIAVALAEFGPRADLYATLKRGDLLPWIVLAALIAAAVAGHLTAPMLNERADAFLIGLSLAFAAFGQLQRVKPASGLVARTLVFWGGGVPLIVFALATRFGGVASVGGAVAGMAAAAVLTRAARNGSVARAPFRWAAAAALAAAGAWVMIAALQLL